MKKVLLITLTALLCSLQTLYAQSWNLVGNSNATSASKLGTTNNISLRFYTNNVQRMIINSAAGYVGIGTITPTERLHVNSASGANAFRAQVNGSTKLLVHSNGGVVVGISATPPANGLYVSGNTGIGTATPVSKLEVRNGTLTITNTTTSATLAINRANSVAGSANQIAFVDNGVTKWALGGTNIGSARADNFSFYNYNLGSNALTILNSNNNVGIGTTDPGNYKLKLSYDQGSANGSYGLDIENKSSGSRVDWELYVAPDNHPTYYGALLFFRNGYLLAGINSAGQYRELSDERLKTNIKPMATMLNKINELKPSTYQFKNTRDGQEHNGFIAQDVMKIFPTLVTHNVIPERKLDVYTMDYSGFGVLAIKGIQELQPIIEEQKEKIAILEDAYKLKIATLEDRISKLEAALATITANNNGNLSTVITNASLEQNNPNPVAGNTTIRYQVPTTSTSAKVTITNVKGQLIKAIIIGNMGAGQVNFNSATLPAGSYNYSLWVDGKQVDTKRLIIAR